MAPEEIQRDLDVFIAFYNEQRTHQGYRLKGRTPAQALRKNHAGSLLPIQPAGTATDAPSNPNTPGTTRQDRDSGAFARAAAEPASASTFDRQGRMAFVFLIERSTNWAMK
jgi:hypothetical protein